ncbi:MAG: prolipoprotein diacylglyceryl transferase [Clostridiales Family XIII bacterium]|jgi:phosphatidylglycerol:prolipoprotein diacylglycerol transferase|nr:prolipoprotein diacylglyceryl transferase [Clostridiales Family XIII bacterium]
MPSPPDRIAFSVFGFDIMWYGIIVTLAIATAVFITCYRGKAHGISADKVIDFLIICVPMGLVGARLYYVLFNLNAFKDAPAQIFNIRAGGLAIHGALIFGLLTAVILCRLWRVGTLNAFDLAAPSLAIAQAIGRWGNYMNQEAHGGPTDLPWAIVVDGVKVHPTFLYESLWCLLLFFILISIDRRRKFDGQIFLIYCMMYSFERFFVEQLRTDSLILFGMFKQAQVLSCIVFVVCVPVYFWLKRRARFSDRLFY